MPEGFAKIPFKKKNKKQKTHILAYITEKDPLGRLTEKMAKIIRLAPSGFNFIEESKYEIS